MNTEKNDRAKAWPLASQCWTMVEAGLDLSLGSFPDDRFDAYAGLLADWNDYAGLISAGDLKESLDAHVADSLALAPYCWSSDSSRLLDIGSGGGFPAIPLAIAFPELNVVCVERRERKVAFLMKVTAALGLAKVTLMHGHFPECVEGERFDFIVARAIERPAEVHPLLFPWIGQGSAFLLQRSDCALFESSGFLVTEMVDAFSEGGFRRGRLWMVRVPPELLP